MIVAFPIVLVGWRPREGMGSMCITLRHPFDSGGKVRELSDRHFKGRGRRPGSMSKQNDQKAGVGIRRPLFAKVEAIMVGYANPSL